MHGFLYILSHSSMPNLLKVGFTSRTVAERMQELVGTGVPGRFEAEFYCEVNEAPRLERAIHRRLSKHHYDKEFFRISVELAVRLTKETLLEQGIVVLSTGGRSRHAYLTDQERAELRRAEERLVQERLAESQRIAALARQREVREAEVRSLVERFERLAPSVEMTLRRKSVLGSGGALREIASYAFLFTIVGAPLADKLNPTAKADGKGVARKLTADEIVAAKELFAIISKLRQLDAWEPVAQQYYKRSKPRDRYLVVYVSYLGRYDVSDLVTGVFEGLGLAS